ncbi:hypothetical protein PHLGIDRAFT_151386 [Phlebiopsis gigantea 11061_1 CR5-6]|uniref:Uncharacterized protein n=1 Tax=Phlebiopsis gigantea (strain 11061_1 CR5-6) TaxID=745531 RepID=A0A0C3PHS8_PHLG1|nr:hypothetical protein PHLGIDRAFT_151386 [Phlebiopsis gigantea 11061_1 CR5-6]
MSHAFYVLRYCSTQGEKTQRSTRFEGAFSDPIVKLTMVSLMYSSKEQSVILMQA